MAETLLWRSYCEQRGLTYHFEPSYGISLLIMAVFGVIAAGIKVQSYVHRLRLPDEWHFPWSPGNIAVIMAMLTTKCIYILEQRIYIVRFRVSTSQSSLSLMVTSSHSKQFLTPFGCFFMQIDSPSVRGEKGLCFITYD